MTTARSRLPIALAWAVALVCALLLPRAVMGQTCNTAIAFGLDVSGSMNTERFNLQREGTAAALLDDEVVDLFLRHPGSVYVLVFEWSAQDQQQIVVDWTRISGRDDLEHVAAALLRVPRSFRGQTAVGAAIAYGAQQLQRVSCLYDVLNISGDNMNNNGPRPLDVRMDDPNTWGITINGLPIGQAWLHDWFENNVRQGALGFVEPALNFMDFQRAMTRKIHRELDITQVSE